MPSFEINAKELFIAMLRKAGVPFEVKPDGSRWVNIDVLYDWLQRRKSADRLEVEQKRVDRDY